MDSPSPADNDGADQHGAGQAETRRSRRRSRRSTTNALLVDMPQAALPAPSVPEQNGSQSILPPEALPHTPPQKNAIQRRRTAKTALKAQEETRDKIHLKSEPIDSPAANGAAGEENAAKPINSTMDRFQRETSHYVAYAYRLVFSRLVLVVALLCFLWALWQAFQAVVNSYYRNLDISMLDRALDIFLTQAPGWSLTLT